jgi:hypothetical protein
MNWTEGNLARHARRSRGRQTFLKQKEHFAKARTAGSSGSASRRRAFLSLSKDRSEDDHGNAAQSSSRRRATNSAFKDQFDKHLTRASRFWSSDTGHGKDGMTLCTRRRADASSSDEVLAEKRRKLLEKSDWVGLGLQKPVEVTFGETEPTTKNGKWSKYRNIDATRPRVHTADDDSGWRGKKRDIQHGKGRPHRPVKITVGSQYMNMGDNSTVWKHAGSSRSSAACSHDRCSSRSFRSSSRSYGTLSSCLVHEHVLMNSLRRALSATLSA